MHFLTPVLHTTIFPSNWLLFHIDLAHWWKTNDALTFVNRQKESWPSRDSNSQPLDWQPASLPEANREKDAAVGYICSSFHATRDSKHFGYFPPYTTWIAKYVEQDQCAHCSMLILVYTILFLVKPCTKCALIIGTAMGIRPNCFRVLCFFNEVFSIILVISRRQVHLFMIPG